MELNTKIIGSIAVLLISGRFDAHEIGPVSTWLQERLDAKHRHLVVNLGGTNFIDSTALSGLIRGLKRSREQGGDLYLCNLQTPVRIIFELTRLDKAFSIYASEEEALAAFETPQQSSG